MQLELLNPPALRVIFPYIQRNHTYYLLFTRNCTGPFFVRDTAYKITTLFNIGEIYTVPEPGKIRVVGNIFFTKSKCNCQGSFIIGYSGVFADQVQRSLPKDLNMQLVLKERNFHVFNEKNRATLIVSPALHTNIRENLEI
jgi:hypothetical protein